MAKNVFSLVNYFRLLGLRWLLMEVEVCILRLPIKLDTAELTQAVGAIMGQD